MIVRSWISRVLSASPLAFLPVTVRKGPARGARWTLLPFSANWRQGGEGDLLPGLRRLANVDGAVCWDFGAHFGIHSVGMAMAVGPSGQVASFEPDPVAFARLEHHVRINRLSQLVLIRAAASDRSGPLVLISSGGLGNTLSHLRYSDEPEPAARKTLEIGAHAADDLVAEGRIRLPDLIKVDVQGHGAKALEGSAVSLRASLPVIIFSGHGRDEVAATQALLGPLHYNPMTLEAEPVDWQALESRTGLLIPESGRHGSRR